MTGLPLAEAATDDRPDETGPSVACPVCRHDLTAHDSIGRRFCRATQTQALSRNCICVH